MKIVVKYSDYGVWRYVVALKDDNRKTVDSELVDTSFGVWYWSRKLPRRYAKKLAKERRAGKVLGETKLDTAKVEKKAGGLFRK